MSAREEILARIAAAGVSPVRAERPEVTASPREREAIIAQFIEYAADYKANVVRTNAEEFGAVVAGFLTGRTLVPVDLPTEGIVGMFVPDEGLSTAELDAADSVLTLCAVAVAETGTVVLDHGPGQGRRALTLVPDHHVVIVPAERIVDTVPEAVAALAHSVQARRPLTWISGPSATSDIELSRVEGVHGPRRLDLVIVG